MDRYLSFGPASWQKMKARNKACPRICVASVVYTLTCADKSRRDLGTKVPSPGAAAKPFWAGRTPLLWQGSCPDVRSPKCGLPQKVCGFCLSQKLLASAVHTLTCADQSWRNPGTQYGSPRCCGKAFPGWDGHLSSGREGAQMSGA